VLFRSELFNRASKMDDSDKLLEEANDFYMNDDYKNALDLYTKGIENSVPAKKYKFLVGRSQTYLKLNDFDNALKDAEDALALNPDDPKVYIKKGTALFNLKNYADASDAFEQGKKIDESGKNSMKNIFTDWANKCKEQLDVSAKKEIEIELAKAKIEDKVAVEVKAPPKVKNEWYQTESYVTVSILLKNFKKEDILITPGQKTLSVKSSESYEHKFEFNFDLAHEVSLKDTQIKFLSTKIEIKLKKLEAIHWASLEHNGPIVKTMQTPSNSIVDATNGVFILASLLFI